MVRRKISEKDMKKIIKDAIKEAMDDRVNEAIKAANNNSALEGMTSTPSQQVIAKAVLSGQIPFGEGIERIVKDAKTR